MEVMMNSPKNSKTYVSDRSSRDWLVNDPRSVRAMLDGRGDSRARRYEQYVATRRQANPTLREDELLEGYPDYVRRTSRPLTYSALRSYGSDGERTQAIRAEVYAELPRLAICVDVLIKFGPWIATAVITAKWLTLVL